MLGSIESAVVSHVVDCRDLLDGINNEFEIKNCVFTENETEEDATVALLGDGVGTGNALVDSCSLIGNIAKYSGAIQVVNKLDSEIYFVLSNSIFKDNIAEESGYTLDEGALQIFLDVFKDLYTKRDNKFGNARTARNILYKAISIQEERISSMYDYEDADLTTIMYEDVADIKLEEI